MTVLRWCAAQKYAKIADFPSKKWAICDCDGADDSNNKWRLQNTRRNSMIKKYIINLNKMIVKQIVLEIVIIGLNSHTMETKQY